MHVVSFFFAFASRCTAAFDGGFGFGAGFFVEGFGGGCSNLTSTVTPIARPPSTAVRTVTFAFAGSGHFDGSVFIGARS